MDSKWRSSVTALFISLILTACAQPFIPKSSQPAISARPSPVSTALPPAPKGKSDADVLPTAPGIYTYTTILKSPQGEDRSEHSDEYEPAIEVSPGVFRQKVWHLQDSNRRPYFVESLVRADGSFALSQSSWGPICSYGPPLRELPNALMKVGTKRSYRSFCANDTVPRREIIGYMKVLRKEDLTIAGQTVSTLVLDYYGKVIGHKNNTAFFNKGTEWYSPERRLSIKRSFKYNSIPTQSADLEYSEELKSLDPT